MPEPDEREAFERLVREHHAAVYRSARRVLQSDGDAMDVAQEVFLEVLRERARFDEAEEPGRVLRWMAARKALAYARAARNRRRREEAHAMGRSEVERDGFEQDGGAGIERVELRALVSRLFGALPDELRVALALRFGEGMTYAAIAEAVDCSEPTAHERVRRGLERLRERLGRAGHATPAPAVAGMLADLDAPGAAAAVPAELEARLLALASSAGKAGLAGALAPIFAGCVALALVVGAAVLVAREPAESRADEVAALAPAAEAELASAPPAAPPSPGAARDLVVPLGAPGELAIELFEPGAGALERPAPASGTVVGRVVDPDRRPIAGAEVSADSFARSGKLARFRAESTTDEEGRFALALPVEEEDAQDYVLVARHPEHVRHRVELALAAGQMLELGELECARASDDLPGAFALSAHVVDEAGVPVEGAVLAVTRRVRDERGGWRSESEASGRTDAAGHVRVEGNRLGEKEVVVQAERQGYRPARFELAIERPGPVQRTFELQRGLAIAGRVVCVESPEAPPHPQVHVVAGQPERWLFADVAPDGRFELRGLEEGRHVLHFRADGRSPARVELEAGSAGALVELKREEDPRDVGAHMAELHGRVVDAATGEPLAVDFWSVDVEWVSEAERSLAPAQLHALRRVARPVQRAAFGPLPEPSDRFHRVGFESGTYLVVVRLRDRAPAFAGPIDLAEGEVVAGLELRVGRGGSASGVLLDRDGRPLAGGYVWLGPAEPDAAARLRALDEALRREESFDLYACTRTDERGRFRLEHLPPGIPFATGALHPTHAPARGPDLELREGEERTDLELRLTPR